MRTLRYASLGCLLLGAVLAIPFQHTLGCLVFLVGVACALATKDRSFTIHMVALFLSITVLALTPVSTDTSMSHVLIMSIGCLSVLLIPRVLLLRSKPLRWQWFSARQWSAAPMIYLFVAVVLAYFLLPWYFHTFSSVPAKWPMPQTYSAEAMIRLFIGTNLLGIWDELFFISTVFVMLLRFFPFGIANASQALLFTGFLYELGFVAIGPLLIVPFTLLQGMAFRRVESLSYVILLHLAIDAVLFFTIMQYHYPGFASWLPFV